MLEIASDYSKTIKNKILLINENNILPEKIKNNFDEIIFYDDSLPYTKKLSKVLNRIKTKYILFTHEVDIILNIDENIINKLVNYMDYGGLDRIDLQPNGGNTRGKYVKISKDKTVNDWEVFENINQPHLQLSDDVDWFIGEHTDPHTYIFNVNPSIWKLDSYLEILNNFPDRTYRNIEDPDVQNFCTKFKIYNLHSRNVLHCGYLKCLPFYKYIHITHYRRLLRFDGNFKDEFNQSYRDAAKEYIDIVNNYNLKSGKRPFS